MANLFEKLNANRPPSVEQTQPEIIRLGPAATTIPPVNPKAPLTDKFLAWLLDYWVPFANREPPTISLREICRNATPHAIRDWEVAMDLTDILVQRGWLVRCPGQKRRDRRIFQIIRGPKATLSQKVAEK